MRVKFNRVLIRNYEPTDEVGWLRCRVLAFLNTAYFDNVLRQKESYSNPSIELVAMKDNILVGLIDIECELQQGDICTRGEGLGGMIWHIAVHPDYQSEGIGTQLLDEALKLVRHQNIAYLEAWTRDDIWVQNWYKEKGFNQVSSYLHVYISDKELKQADLHTSIQGLQPIQSFAHYSGENREEIKKQFTRVHDCVCYELIINE